MTRLATSLILLHLLTRHVSTTPSSSLPQQQQQQQQQRQATASSPLTHFFVFGDKYSGVQYTTNLLRKNLLLSDCIGSSSSASASSSSNVVSSWQHDIVSLRDFYKLTDNTCHPSTTLFILTVKDPYAWVVSVAKRHFELSSHDMLQKRHIRSLLTTPWNDRDRDKMTTTKEGRRWRWIWQRRQRYLLQRRIERGWNRRSFLKTLPHAAVIRYEDLIQNGVGITLSDALRHRGLSLRYDRIRDVPLTAAAAADGDGNAALRQLRRYYVDKKYLSLFDDNSDIATLVSRRLDARLEKTWGYEVRSSSNRRRREEERTTTRRRRRSVVMRLMGLVMDLLWWIVVPTVVVLLVIVTPLILWQRGRMMKETTTKGYRRRSGSSSYEDDGLFNEDDSEYESEEEDDSEVDNDDGGDDDDDGWVVTSPMKTMKQHHNNQVVVRSNHEELDMPYNINDGKYYTATTMGHDGRTTMAMRRRTGDDISMKQREERQVESILRRRIRR